jgi:hypothetical protein
MYKIIQNYLQSNEYEYLHEYNSIDEALKDIKEYEAEDIENGYSYNYTIVDMDYNDVMELQKENFNTMAINTLKDIGIPEDEAENILSDYQFI